MVRFFRFLGSFSLRSWFAILRGYERETLDYNILVKGDGDVSLGYMVEGRGSY